MRIILLDINLAKCGWAVIDTDGNMLDVGTIVTATVKRKSNVRVADAMFDRYRELARELARLIKQWEASGVVMELPHGGAQSQRAAVAMAAGSAIAATVVETAELPYEAYTPTENKMNATGLRNASKDQMIARAQQQWPDAKWPKTKAKLEDAADAACLWFSMKSGTLLNLLRKAV